MLYQQGDVLLESGCVIPDDCCNKRDNHLAEGEATGHFHAAVGSGVAVLEQSTGSLFLRAPAGAVINHQEHDTIHVAPGNYKVHRVLEYDHFTEEAKAVAD